MSRLFVQQAQITMIEKFPLKHNIYVMTANSTLNFYFVAFSRINEPLPRDKNDSNYEQTRDIAGGVSALIAWKCLLDFILFYKWHKKHGS